ncbi:MAG: hypothetical protein WC661_06305 [Opitutaceae bacterium]|jgi:hypothetical protein
MKTSLARTNAILPYEAAADLTGYVGRFVSLTAGKVSLVSSATVKPHGVLLTDGKAGERVTVAVGAGGLAGVIRVKLAAAVTAPGTDLQLTADGLAQTDAGTGARVIVAQSLETGAVDELIEAVLFRPVTLT